MDAIDGVDYEVPFRMEYDDPSQDLHIDLQAGMQKLDGDQVVEFLRWRHNNDYSVQYENGDEGRVENQQKFLKELARQVLQLKNVTKIPKIAEAVFNNVKTDLTAGNLLWMGMQALQIDNDDIQVLHPARLRRDEHGRRVDRVLLLLPVLSGDARSGQRVFQPL